MSGVYNMDKTDEVLVRECLNGDKESFADLVKRYQDQVFNLAFRMTHSWADAEDMTQEAFIRAYRKLETYRSEYSFRNWVMTICANLTKNVFWKRMRSQEVEQLHFELRYLEEKPDASVDREALEKVLGRLSPALRVPLVLKYAEGYAYEEIAKILNIRVSAAKMRVKRGRAQMAELMSAAMHVRGK